ncbi:hypothetical protein MINS_07160 [Mycolicibacterium insubricum]|nr:hypothetical protein MINS_07160 [Mycolicibacterium insubricum]
MPSLANLSGPSDRNDGPVTICRRPNLSTGGLRAEVLCHPGIDQAISESRGYKDARRDQTTLDNLRRKHASEVACTSNTSTDPQNRCYGSLTRAAEQSPSFAAVIRTHTH